MALSSKLPKAVNPESQAFKPQRLFAPFLKSTLTMPFKGALNRNPKTGNPALRVFPGLWAPDLGVPDPRFRSLGLRVSGFGI